MMNLKETLQSKFVDYWPVKPKALGLILPQERTKQESEELEAVIVSLCYHGYSVTLIDETQGFTINGNPMHVLLHSKEHEGYPPKPKVVRMLMNAEKWSKKKQEVRLGLQQADRA